MHSFKLYCFCIQERMEPKLQDAEEQGLIKSTFEETSQAIEDRINLIHGLHFSLESELVKSNDPLKTISDIMPGLAVYYFSQSPVQPSLRDLYTSKYLHTQYRCVLPPPSQGEESVNEQQSTQPSFKWISRTIIDSTLLTLDQVEAKKTQRGKVPEEWGTTTELLIYNISKKIHSKSDVKSIEKYLRNNLSKWGSLKTEKTRQIYYKGKCSILLRFSDESSCFVAYYNLLKHQQSRKEHLGQDSDVYRVVSNRIKNIQQQKWVAVLFRRLPINLTKEALLEILRKRNISPVWMEELIQIDNFKYTLCKVSFLDDAFELCSHFQINSPLKEVKVNLHPKSCKAWKRDHEEFLT